MNGISKTEIKVIADLEFKKRYYFTIDDILSHFVNVKQRYNTLRILQKKGRIIKLNRKKYFLVPIKARQGKWTDYPLIIADEICDGKDYFIGGWYAAYYWGLTEQVPLQLDVYTTKRQGTVELLNSRFMFHRTTPKRIKTNSIARKFHQHSFRILTKSEAKKWIKSKQ